MVPARQTPALVLTFGVVLLGGCSRAQPPTSLVTPPAASAASSVSSSASASARSASPSASHRARRVPSLGGTCEDLLPVGTVEDAIGRPVVGTTAFVVGVPEPNIGREAYLNCRYGVSKPVRGKKTPPPQIEIGISLYDNPGQAGRRIDGTIEDYRSHGAAPADVAVDQYSGTVLTGYGSPTIVVGAGPRTVAVTVDDKLVRTGRNQALVALAKAALAATQRFVQSEVITPSAKATTN